MSLHKLLLLALAVSMPAVSAKTFAEIKKTTVDFAKSKKGISTLTATAAVAIIFEEAYRTMPKDGNFAEHLTKMVKDAVANPSSNPAVFAALVAGVTVPTACGAKHVYNVNFSHTAQELKKALKIEALRVAPKDETAEAKTKREAELKAAEDAYAEFIKNDSKEAKEEYVKAAAARAEAKRWAGLTKEEQAAELKLKKDKEEEAEKQKNAKLEAEKQAKALADAQEKVKKATEAVTAAGNDAKKLEEANKALEEAKAALAKLAPAQAE